MQNGDLEHFKGLLEQYSPSTDNFSESLEQINKFFEEFIIKGIRNRTWNLGIRIERKGSQIYLDQQASKKELSLLYVIGDRTAKKFSELIRGKSVLIFDDSIKRGYNIRRVLKMVLPLAADITVAVLLSRIDTLERLKSKYPSVKFHVNATSSKDDFSRNYLKKIQPYLDIICSPIQYDHPLLSIDFNGSLNMNEIADIFNKYGCIKEDDCKKFEYINGDKRLFKFKSDTFNELPIFENMRELGILHKNTSLEDAIIIRMYIRNGFTSRLILQPIILEGFAAINDRKDIISIDTFVKRQIIYQFLINKIMPKLAAGNIMRFSIVFD